MKKQVQDRKIYEMSAYGYSYDEFMESFEYAVSLIKCQVGDQYKKSKIRIDISSGQYGDSPTLEVSHPFMREEFDHEYEQRIRREKKLEENDRKIYERLKEKFK